MKARRFKGTTAMKYPLLSGTVGLLCALLVSLPAMADDAPIRVIENLSYTDARYENDKDKLDLYVPDEAKDAPVLVFFHGGALIRGDKAGQKHVGRRFAGAGFLTVCANYRLSPGVMHPAHVEDSAAAIAWVVKNIASYGGDPGRIFVAGHSAGAYLAALVALDPRYLEAHDLSPSLLRGVIPISGFFHVDRLAPSRPKYVWGADEPVWGAASPSTYVSADAPPMLFLYADHDAPERRKENTDIVQELKAAGHDAAASTQIADRNHATIWQRLNADGDETSKRTLAFMRAILDGS